MSQNWQELKSKLNFRLLDIIDNYRKTKSNKSYMQVSIAMHSLVKLTHNAMMIALYAANEKGMPLNKRWKIDIENVALQDSSDISLQKQELFQNTSGSCFCPCSLWQVGEGEKKKKEKKKKTKEKKKKYVNIFLFGT